MGLVAEAALRQKGQHSLCSEPLQALSVYERLRRISRMNGKESEQRKNALLRGLFLEATPLEGKYIARTALRNMLAGIGHKTMLAALFQAFHCDQNRGLKGLQPHARSGKNSRNGPQLRSGKNNRPAQDPHQFHDKSLRQCIESRIRMRTPEVCLSSQIPGLRVQVHKIKWRGPHIHFQASQYHLGLERLITVAQRHR